MSSLFWRSKITEIFSNLCLFINWPWFDEFFRAVNKTLPISKSESWTVKNSCKMIWSEWFQSFQGDRHGLSVWVLQTPNWSRRDKGATQQVEPVESWPAWPPFGVATKEFTDFLPAYLSVCINPWFAGAKTRCESEPGGVGKKYKLEFRLTEREGLFH